MPQIQALSVQSLSDSIVDLNPELLALGKAVFRDSREADNFVFYWNARKEQLYLSFDWKEKRKVKLQF